MPGESFTISLMHAATHVPVEPGSTIVLRGSLLSRHDGSLVDAVSTTWPADAPGGASVDAGGLFDLPAGGFELVAHDAGAHHAELVATDGPAPACGAFGVPSPCLVLRADHLAHARLLTVGEWASSLRGQVRVETNLAPFAVGSATGTEQPLLSWQQSLALTAAMVMLLALCVATYRRMARSSRRRLTSLIRRVSRSAKQHNPVLARVLTPALCSAKTAVRRGRIAPDSAAGQKLAEALRNVDTELRDEASRKQRDAEHHALDDLLGQVEVALQAASEASRAT